MKASKWSERKTGTAGSFLSSTQIKVFLYQGSLIREEFYYNGTSIGFLAEVSIVQRTLCPECQKRLLTALNEWKWVKTHTSFNVIMTWNSPRLPRSDDSVIGTSDQHQLFDFEEVLLPLWDEEIKHSKETPSWKSVVYTLLRSSHND